MSECPACHREAHEDARFCSHCGAPLLGRAGEAWGERRQLTIVFCDLVDSTEIAAALDVEEWAEITRDYHRAVAAEVTPLGGHVAHYLGDGVLVYFGYPHAGERDAERGVRAALAMIDAVAQLSARLSASRGIEIAARVGVHTGTVAVAPGALGEPVASGDAIHLAARVQTFATPHTVVVTAATLRLVRGLFVVAECGPQRLKGISEPVELFRVVRSSGARSGLDAAAARGFTRFVDRDEERTLLASRWALVQDGTGQVVFLGGEPGIGKSRLIRTLKEQLEGVRHVWLECAGVPYLRNTPLHPVVELLQQLLEWRSDEPAEDRLTRLERALEATGSRPADVIPLVAPLLSLPADRYPPPTLSPEAMRRKTLAALAEWLFAVARHQPVVLVVEDLHWVDPTTLELHGLLVEGGATVPLLQLCSARPEFAPTWPAWPHCTHVTLRRLPSGHVREMIDDVAGPALPGSLLDAVAHRSDGVPLFVEELTKAVVEARTGGTELPIPETLEDSLMARLDRLGPAKEVAQVAAVIGREFAYGLLEHVSGMRGPDLPKMVAQLVDAGLLYSRGVPPDATFVFKHALIRDSAYASLFRSRRRELHQRIAHALANRVGTSADADPEVLAHHHAHGGDAEAALVAWQRAGKQAVARSAFVEAIAHYEKALEILPTLPETRGRAERELVLHIAKGTALMATRGYGAAETAAAYARARELGEQVGNPRQLLFVLSGLWVSSFTRGEFLEAQELADQALLVAERDGAPASRTWACVFQGISRYNASDLPTARDYLERAVALYDETLYRTAQTDPGIPALGYAGMAAWHLGFPDLADRRATSVVELGRRLGKAYDLAYAYALASVVAILRGEVDRLLSYADPMIELGREQHLPFYLALGTMNRGWAWAAQGRHAEGIALLGEGFDLYRSTGSAIPYVLYLCLRADVHARGGDVEQALAIIDDALATVPADQVDRPELFRVRADLLVRVAAERSSIEAAHREALDVARRLGSRGYELRAATCLARWLGSIGRRDPARDVLEPVLASFSEGFDTRDVREARALLGVL